MCVNATHASFDACELKIRKQCPNKNSKHKNFSPRDDMPPEDCNDRCEVGHCVADRPGEQDAGAEAAEVQGHEEDG
jgi:hypothetical protein